MITDGDISALFWFRYVAKFDRPSHHTISVALPLLDRVEHGVLFEHLSHIALPAVTMPALNCSGLSPSSCCLWVSPNSEVLFNHRASHTAEVEAGDGRSYTFA